jgi:hypothetical protein
MASTRIHKEEAHEDSVHRSITFTYAAFLREARCVYSIRCSQTVVAQIRKLCHALDAERLLRISRGSTATNRNNDTSALRRGFFDCSKASLGWSWVMRYLYGAVQRGDAIESSYGPGTRKAKPGVWDPTDWLVYMEIYHVIITMAKREINSIYGFLLTGLIRRKTRRFGLEFFQLASSESAA